MTFSLKKAVLCIADICYISNNLKLNSFLMMHLFLLNMQLFTSQDVNWWTGVVWITCRLLWCFYQLFGLSFWRHPFTAEHPLVNKWCNATFHQICFYEGTNSSRSWTAWGWVNILKIFLFERTIPLTVDFNMQNNIPSDHICKQIFKILYHKYVQNPFETFKFRMKWLLGQTRN